MLYRSLVRTKYYTIADHTRILILAEALFDFHALAYTGACLMGYPIADHAQTLMLAERVFNCHALAYTGACLQLWVIRLQTMHKY